MTGYIDHCYNDQPLGTPTPVTVTVGTTSHGFDASLGAGGAIAGKVTDAAVARNVLTDVQVSVSSPTTGANGYAWTGADGTYTVTGLPAGTDYTVCFYASGATGGSSDLTGYIDRCYNDQPLGTPTPVTVTVGATMPGIDASLAAGA